jgi:hypothetical protein
MTESPSHRCTNRRNGSVRLGLHGNGGRYDIAHIGFRNLGSIAPDGSGSHLGGINRKSSGCHGNHLCHDCVGHTCLDSAVQHGGAVVPVDLSVYDTNGNEGIPVPGSEELNAVKEIAANMGAGMGSSITITDDAGSQLLSDLGRSAIQGVSQYVSKKMRSVKVTLKAGYSVLLLPPLQ